MKHFRSEYAFQKYKPHVSWRKKLLRFFRKKEYIIASPQDSFHYKSNPFRKHKKPTPIKFKLILFIVFLLIWVICLAYISYFKVNKINYFGLNNTTKEELNEFIYGNFLNKKSILPLNNYFFINSDKISGELYKKFALETVEVAKIFPNQLNVEIKEKISSVIYDNGKAYFLLDSRGTAIKHLKDTEPYETIIKITTSTKLTTSTVSRTSSAEHIPDYKKITGLFGNYPIVYDRRSLDINLKQENILPPEHIMAIITWYKALTEQGIATPKFFILDNLNSGIVLDTTDPWDILFQPKNDTITQINNLKNILPTIKPREYVNLDFGKKIFWK